MSTAKHTHLLTTHSLTTHLLTHLARKYTLDTLDSTRVDSLVHKLEVDTLGEREAKIQMLICG